jgi:hypothetical protein
MCSFLFGLLEFLVVCGSLWRDIAAKPLVGRREFTPGTCLAVETCRWTILRSWEPGLRNQGSVQCDSFRGQETNWIQPPYSESRYFNSSDLFISLSYLTAGAKPFTGSENQLLSHIHPRFCRSAGESHTGRISASRWQTNRATRRRRLTCSHSERNVSEALTVIRFAIV